MCISSLNSHSWRTATLARLPLSLNSSIPSIYFQNAKQLMIPATSPTISIAVIYLSSLRHMSVLCQRIRDASYCSAALEWCQPSYRAFTARCGRQSHWQFLQRCQYIASFMKLLHCFSAPPAVPWRAIARGENWRVMSSFQHGLNMQVHWALKDDDDDGAGQSSGHVDDYRDDVSFPKVSSL